MYARIIRCSLPTHAIQLGLGLQLCSLALRRYVPADGMQGLLLAGAAYLAWLGWQLLRSRAPLGLSLPAATPNGSSRSALAGGAAVCLLNPKAYLFILAVFP